MRVRLRWMDLSGSPCSLSLLGKVRRQCITISQQCTTPCVYAAFRRMKYCHWKASSIADHSCLFFKKPGGEWFAGARAKFFSISVDMAFSRELRFLKLGQDCGLRMIRVVSTLCSGTRYSPL